MTIDWLLASGTWALALVTIIGMCVDHHTINLLVRALTKLKPRLRASPDKESHGKHERSDE